MPHIRIENVYWRTPEFLQFSISTEFSVYMFLMAHIVRDSKKILMPLGARIMRDNYYKKGMLCASYGMSNIAKIFGWFSKNRKTGKIEPNRGNVSRKIKKLEKMGLLKIIPIPSPIGQKYVYQFGYIENGKEVLFFDQIFSAKAAHYRLNKLVDSERPENRYFGTRQKPEQAKNVEIEIDKLIIERQRLAKEAVERWL